MQLSDIQIPIPGKHSTISAKWAGDMTRAMNARRLIAGKGIKLKKSPGGILIESTATGTSVVKSGYDVAPFMCRYVTSEENELYDGWEIYLPPGCVSIGSSGIPLNVKAQKTIEANDVKRVVDIDDWYRLEVPENIDFGSDEELIWNVVVEFKGCAAHDGVDSFATIESMPRCYMWARAFDGRSEKKDEEWNTKDAGGTTFSVNVGTIKITESENTDNGSTEGDGYGRTFIHSVKRGVYATDSSYAAMRLIHAFDNVYVVKTWKFYNRCSYRNFKQCSRMV